MYACMYVRTLCFFINTSPSASRFLVRQKIKVIEDDALKFAVEVFN